MQVIVPGNSHLPAESGIPRCGQRSSSAYALPAWRTKTRSRPSSRHALGFFPSFDDGMAGCQYSGNPSAAAA